MDSFITYDNREIKFVKGWYESKNSWPFGITKFDEFVDKCIVNPARFDISNNFFLNKLVVFNYFKNVIEECNLTLKWNNVLDIGTGPGIHPRFIRSAGMCNKAFGIDIVNRDIGDKLFNDYVGSKIKDDSKRSIIDTQTVFTSYYPISFPTNKSESDILYIESDFMEYKFDVKFDCITALMCAEYFDPDVLFDKIYSLLDSNGIFFMIVDNWYELYGGSMHLPVDAPWLHARVTKDDLIRYYREVHPEIAKTASNAIYFARSHMTPIDYNNIAKGSGLTPITYRRSFNGLIGENSYNLSSFVDNYIPEIESDIKSVNVNACMSDLYTYYLTMIFRKDN